MSMFLPDNFQSSDQQTPGFSGTPDSPAGPEDVALMQRVLAAAAQNPSLIPESFMAYVMDWLQTSNMNIPISQVFGYNKSVNSIVAQALAKQFTVHVASGGVSTLSHTFGGGDAYVSAAGPSLSGLDAGSYLLIGSFESQASFPDGSVNIFQVVNNSVFVKNISSPQTTGAIDVAAVMPVTIAASTSVTTSLILSYATSGSAYTTTISAAQLIALRYA